MRVDAVKRFRAWLLLATFVASLGSSQLSADHFGLVDSACGVVGLATAGSAKVRTATKAVPQHCPICHVIRAVSGASATPVASLAVAARVTLPPAQVVQLPPAVDTVPSPSRGPPTLTLSVVL
ncbi:MAG: hypothetical protein ABIP90_11370 [Vicinamibacterales bacterium]